MTKTEKNLRDRLMRQTLKLEYNGDYPEDTDLTNVELYALLDDYEEYVQKCYGNNQRPKTHNDFKKFWSIIFNADLAKKKIGDEVYYCGLDNILHKTNITKLTIDTDGTVLCMIKEFKFELGAGELYKTDKKWDD
jgi:prolyl oligopeptidase PreP (S9A serine peptidase family)